MVGNGWWKRGLDQNCHWGFFWVNQKKGVGGHMWTFMCTREKRYKALIGGLGGGVMGKWVEDIGSVRGPKLGGV